MPNDLGRKRRYLYQYAAFTVDAHGACMSGVADRLEKVENLHKELDWQTIYHGIGVDIASSYNLEVIVNFVFHSKLGLQVFFRYVGQCRHGR